LVEFLKQNGFKEVNLIKSSGGAFEVKADGRLLFSKLETGRFPKNEEILALLVKIAK
jgi:selT/selW/selH-like putative selenoprotein